MDLRFTRWTYRRPDGLAQPLLLMAVGGIVQADPGYCDGFADPVAAAEAAGRVTGGLTDDGGATWHQRAIAALTAPSNGELPIFPEVRILDPDDVVGEHIRWLAAAGKPLAGRSSEDWELAPVVGFSPSPVPEAGEPLAPLGLEEDLTGSTGKWALVDLAGVSAAGHHTLPEADPEDLELPTSEALLPVDSLRKAAEEAE